MSDRDLDMRKPSGQTVFLGAVVLASCVLVAYVVFFTGQSDQKVTTPELPIALDSDEEGDDNTETTAPRAAAGGHPLRRGRRLRTSQANL